MAVIYEGKLTLDHNWGDIDGDGSGNVVASGEQIQDLVRTELKKGIGSFYCVSINNLENILLGFADNDSRQNWLDQYKDAPTGEEALNSVLIKSSTKVSKGVPEPYYDVRLENKYISDRYISIDGSIKFPVRFTYTWNEYDTVTGDLIITDQPGTGTLTIQARTSSSEAWENSLSMQQELTPNSSKDTNALTELELTNFIPRNGNWEVRMMVSVTTETGEVQSRPIYMNIVKTEIDINLETNWTLPQRLTIDGQNKPMSLKFSYQGDYVDKYLNIEITGAGDEKGTDPLKRLNIVKLTGSTYTYSVQKAIGEVYNIYAHGIHSITYWIEIDKDSNYSTPKKTAQLMVVADESDTTPYILFNNVQGINSSSPLANWTKEHILDYAVYTPDGKGGSLDSIPVRLSFKDANNSEQLFEQVNVSQGIEYSLERDLSLEIDPGLSTLWLTSETNGEPLKSAKSLVFYVNNAGDYTPSEGATFVFNPRIRSNNESAEDRIKLYNTANSKMTELPQEEVKWTGVKFNNTDGWITDSKNGRCLRLLDKQQLIIPYQPLLVDESGDFVNTTIEITFAIKNIIDNQVPLISICNKKDVTYTNDAGATETTEEINGFELRANDAYFLPKINKTREILDTHDVVFAEGEKLHMAICINQEKEANAVVKGTIPDVPGGDIYSVTLGKPARFIRIYINGILNRVVSFDNVEYDNEDLIRYIVLGNTTDKNVGDLDIYEIKVFHTDSPKENYEILKDYIASLSSTAEKDEIIAKNDILEEEAGVTSIIRNGRISYEKCNQLYNTLLWMPGDHSNNGFARLHGREWGDTGKKSNKYRVGNLKVNYLLHDANGEVVKDAYGKPIKDSDRSGTLYNMSSEGQGTTSMLYFKWNQRYRFDGITDDQDNEIAKSYFTSESGKTIEEGYDLFPNEPVIGRLDGKVNWASSMQTHKMGTVALYHDVWKKVVKNSGITALNSVSAFNNIDLEKTGSKVSTAEEAFAAACEFTGRDNGYGSCRVTVHQEPFLLFTQPTLTDQPMFYGMMTWGASKGDKPTFGYNKNFNKYFVMIEGTDNFRDLISCNIPWDDYHLTQPFDDEDAVDGGIVYPIGGKNTEQFEISMGKDDSEYIGTHWDGKNPCLKMFKDMINFFYLHNPNIVMFEGTYDELVAQKTPGTFNTYDFYWVNKASSTDPAMGVTGSGSPRFELYRWNVNDLDMGGQGAWVPAGFYKSTSQDGSNGYYESLNLLKQFGYVDASGNIDPTHNDIVSLQTSQLNDFFKNKRAARFREGYKNFDSHVYNYHTEYPNGISDFMHVNDLMYTMQFLKLIAATDNWSKNTYIYNSGIYYKKNADGTYAGGSAKYDGLDKFGFFQDDLDTIFEVDNYGSKTKPYYVEEHDYTLNEKGEKDPYWNSEYNGMYKIVELAYPTELKNIMNSILSAMAELKGNPTTCFDEYYQIKGTKSFPEVIYNTTAEQFYLDGYYRGSNRAPDRYAMFLSQCLGDQKSGERDWQKKRVDYLSSYARYGVFAGGTSGSGLAFIPSETIELELTPHIWLYPAAAEGSSNIDYLGSFPESFNVPGRVPAGQNFKLRIVSAAGSENQVVLKGQHFYRDFGNLARVKPLANSFNITGERLSRINIVGTPENKGIVFDAYKSFEASADALVDNIRDINISGNIASGQIFNMNESNLSKLWRLTDLDLSATSIKKVNLAPGSNLTKLTLPAVTQSLILETQLNLTSINLNQAYKNLTEVVITNPSDYIKGQVIDILEKCMNSGADIKTLKIDNIDWVLKDTKLLNYIVNIKESNVKGHIVMDASILIDFNLKYLLLQKFGNIDDPNNGLWIEYTTDPVNAKNAKITGDTYLTKNGSYKYTLSTTGNDFVDVSWSITNNDHAVINPLTGELTFIDKGEGLRELIIYCNITRSSGTINKVEKTIYLYEKTAEIGDYVYYDGSLSTAEEYNSNKTVIGVCYYVNGDDRRMMAVDLASPTPVMWGLSSSQFSLAATAFAIQPSTIGIGSLSSLNSFTDYSSASIETKAIDKDLTSEAYSPNGISAGLKQFPSGTVLSCGQYNTLNIIEHRNEKVINPGIVNTYIPGQNDNYEYVKDEKEHLTELIQNSQSLSRLEIEAALYPAASYCYVYTPTVKPGEVLNEKFTKHNWYLPSMSELLYMWKCSCPNMIGAQENKVGLGLCQELIEAGVWIEPTSWGTSSGPTYWSSNQSGSNNAKLGQFRTANFRTPTEDSTTGGSTSGVNRYYIRACAKF